MTIFTFIISAMIILISIFAVYDEVKNGGKAYFHNAFTVISALGASAMSIAVESRAICFNWWQGIGLAAITIVIAIIMYRFHDDEFAELATYSPLMSTEINLVVFAAASIVAWLW